MSGLGANELRLRQQREADFERRQIKARPRTRSVTRHEMASPPSPTFVTATKPKVGRPCIGDRVMTDAERQRRRRKAKREARA
jgi:hypothetical protein